MTEKKYLGKNNGGLFTDVTTINKDGVLEIPNISKPVNPPGLRPVNKPKNTHLPNQGKTTR